MIIGYARVSTDDQKLEPLDAIRIMEDVAGGSVTEIELAGWFRDRLL